MLFLVLNSERYGPWPVQTQAHQAGLQLILKCCPAFFEITMRLEQAWTFLIQPATLMSKGPQQWIWHDHARVLLKLREGHLLGFVIQGSQAWEHLRRYCWRCSSCICWASSIGI